MEKKKLFIDMDGVLADFTGGVHKLSKEVYEEYAYRHDEVPGIFDNLDPIPGAIDAIRILRKHFDLYIASTASWGNPTSLPGKMEWIKKYFGKSNGNPFYKHVFLTHRKDLLLGDYLIDDRPLNGAKDFTGEWIHFGSKGFESWEEVLNYILNKEGINFSE